MKSGPTKSLFVAGQKRQPTFSEVATVAVTGACFDLSVCVLCWSGELHRRWLGQLARLPNPGTAQNLHLFDANRMTLPEVEAMLSRVAFHLVVLHGVQAAYESDYLSTDYARALCQVVPADMIMWA